MIGGYPKMSQPMKEKDISHKKSQLQTCLPQLANPQKVSLFNRLNR